MLSRRFVMAYRRKSAKKAFFPFFLAVIIFSPLTVYAEIQETTESTNMAAVPDATQEDALPTKDTTAQTMALAAGGTSSEALSSLNSLIQIKSNFVGSATYGVPIEVPPGRGGIAPNLALTYNSQAGNGWLGVGWNLDMGAIQRSTKFGVNYNKNDFVAIANGSSSELVPRSSWGSNYYGAKIEGAFLKYYFNSSSGGWEVTAKNGTKYYYGSSASSRQDNASVVFKWCLDKVQDTNGNYMNITYVKDQGEIYLNRIDYTGNSNLSPTNYVIFYLDNTRSDAPDMYVTNFRVKTASRLKTIEVSLSGQMVRAYKLIYSSSGSTLRSILTNLQLYGNDAQIMDGNVQSGTMLPVFSASLGAAGTGFSTPSTLNMTINTADPGWNPVGDFNGDGKVDVLMIQTGTAGYVNYATDNVFQTVGITGMHFNTASPGWNLVGDFNGDGKADVLMIESGTTGYVNYATDNGFSSVRVTGLNFNTGGPGWNLVGDFNGDGKADVLVILNGTAGYVNYATGNGFQTVAITGMHFNTASPGWNPLGDFNGDGKTDILMIESGTTGYVNYATDNGFSSVRITGLNFNAADPGWNPVGDFNGDGKADVLMIQTGTAGYVNYATGNGFQTVAITGMHFNTASPGWNPLGDFNGDGKTDILMIESPSAGYVMYSTGQGFQSVQVTGMNFNTGGPGWGITADFDGDGKADVLSLFNASMAVKNKSKASLDLIEQFHNGLGGTTSVEYASSTNFQNTRLPFPVQIVKAITANDNNGTLSSVSYTYSGGYYDPAERDFRGFGYVKQINPDQTTVESWFHQDNVFKGMMSQQVVKDSIGNVYDNTTNSFESSSLDNGSVFPFLRRTDEYLFDGTLTAKNVATWFEYDGYGNVTRKYSYGDVSIPGDERDERVEYAYDTTKWIVSQPSRTYVMDNAANIKAQSWFTYDPANGNLLTKTDWLDNGVNPATRFTYNSYGNLVTTTDPKGNVTTISSYDPNYIFPTSITSPPPLNFVTSKTYDFRYGKPLTETDINGNTTTYQYDVFGRPKKVINPYDNTSAEGTQSIYYENFGLGTGYQRVATHSTEQSGTANYLWQENYFDGFGRTIKTRSEGPDGKVIVAETDYDTMGRVSSSSLPYFEGLETARWVSYAYDPMGRVTRVTNPDNTYVTRSYFQGTTTSIDANFHKREEDRDAYGRLAEIREYTGASPNFTLYATTQYRYGLLGTLDNVTDAAGDVTRIGYDTLSRKTSMTDPDMGYWTYQYDANGNLTSQTDARNYTILFSYDALNRLKKKDYPTGTDTVYTYDQTFSTNPKGRLTTVTDASGTTKFYYDKLGRTTKTVKTVSGVGYTTESTYDALGRTASVSYPDTGHEIVNYTYDTGGNLQAVTGYTTYSNYNALGQAGGVTYGNGATTVYQYHPLNNRLFSITTNSLGQGRQNLSYAYDNVGNIGTITDNVDNTRTQSFQYDDLNRIAQAQSTAYGTLTYNINAIGNLTYNSQVGSYTYLPGKPHAVVTAGGNSYTYDPNGNMMGRNGATLTHDYENRLSSLVTGGTTTTFVYDFSGGRVKKTSSSITTLYIGKLYECTSGVCTKHIFAGGNRIVSKKPSGTFYYHTDHLRSSSVITDASGAKVEEIYYYPFGQTRLNSGSVNLHHKYTGQEEDAETGLYFYGARYYDPAIGRFISADTFVQNFSDPQTLNRYSYARNNPLVYRDPSGHFFGIDDLIYIGAVAAAGALLGGAEAAIFHQDIGKGMLTGAISATLFFGAGELGAGLSSVTQAGIHAGAGAVAGGINSSINGGDIGMGMLTGGISGGIGKYAGGFLPDGFGYQLAGRSAIGGVTGGIAAEMYGGSFRQGFRQGARTAAFGFLFNDALHRGWKYMMQDSGYDKEKIRYHNVNANLMLLPYVGPSIGGSYDENGILYLEIGGGVILGSGITYSQGLDPITSGLTVQLQAVAGIGGAKGYDENGKPFREIAYGSPGASATSLYIFEMKSWEYVDGITP
jgi:RHS repeat-associated protein